MTADCRPYRVTTREGSRSWAASDVQHALQQHLDAFPDETVTGVQAEPEPTWAAIMTHARRTASLTQALLEAADLWSGADQDDLAANPEYLKGQVDLMANLFGIDHDLVDDAVRYAIAHPTLGGWKVTKVGHDPVTPWMVTHPGAGVAMPQRWSCFDPGGQFLTQGEAMSAAWDAIRDIAAHRCDGCATA